MPQPGYDDIYTYYDHPIFLRARVPQPNSSGWDRGQDGKLWNGRNGRSGKLNHSSDVIGACICSNDVNVCGSAHCGCVVNGSVAMAAF